MPFDIRKNEIYEIDLPEQPVTQVGENNRPFSVAGTELHGPHRCFVAYVDPDGQQFASVVPLTSAQDPRGGEKWAKWRKSWVRVQHENRAAAALVEQLRYVDRGRFLRKCDDLGQWDCEQIEGKIKTVFGLN